MVDVEQRTLRPLEQHRRARHYRAMNHESHVLRQREESRRETLEQLHRVVGAHALLALEALQLRVRVLHALLHDLTQAIGMTQIEHANAATRDLVFVARPDAATRRPDRRARGALAIDELVVRENEVRAV